MLSLLEPSANLYQQALRVRGRVRVRVRGRVRVRVMVRGRLSVTLYQKARP